MKELIKNYWYIVVIIICFVLVYLIFINNGSDEIELENTILKNEEETIEQTNDEIKDISYFVDIKGEVVKPGVYEVKTNSRIIDVINKAGGLTKNADTTLINLSKKVSDEMNIKIYSKKEVIAAKENINKEPEVIEIIKEIEKECICPENNICLDNKNDAVIENEKEEVFENNSKLTNINVASKEELMSIPGVGESKAINIIEYREKNKFEKIEDIMNVSGIGESIFEKIKEYITV